MGTAIPHAVRFTLAACGALLFAGPASAAPLRDTAPEISVLGFSDDRLLARFVHEVRKDETLCGRALALWRTQYRTRAKALVRRFRTEPDWRPAFADAAALVEDFLLASGLPRRGEWHADEATVWVETLDVKTGRRLRELRPRARATRTIIAPVDGGDALDRIEAPPAPPPARGPR